EPAKRRADPLPRLQPRFALPIPRPVQPVRDRLSGSLGVMFDHITLRVGDLAAAGKAFKAVLDQLEVDQTFDTPSFSVWGDFALTQTDEEHPIARRIRIAFTAPTTGHVDRFG